MFIKLLSLQMFRTCLFNCLKESPSFLISFNEDNYRVIYQILFFLKSCKLWIIFKF